MYSSKTFKNEKINTKMGIKSAFSFKMSYQSAGKRIEILVWAWYNSANDDGKERET